MLVQNREGAFCAFVFLRPPAEPPLFRLSQRKDCQPRSQHRNYFFNIYGEQCEAHRPLVKVMTAMTSN